MNDKMKLEEAIKVLQKTIESNNEVIKEARKNGDINVMQLTADLYNQSIAIKTVLQELRDKEKEIEKLYTIRNEVDYGYENIHIITKNRLATIEKNKYLIEIEDGKFVDIKELYENSIPKKKIEDKIKYWEELKDNYCKRKEYDQVDIALYKIRVLQELLEDK